MAEKQVRIRLAVDGTGEAVVSLERVQKGVSGIGAQTQKTGGALSSFGSQVAGAFSPAAMAAGAVVAGLMGAVRSAMEADKAAARLSMAMGASSASLIAFAEARQSATIYEDDATVSAMARITMVTKEEGAIRALTIAAQNLASRTGKDLETTTNAIAKAAQGSGTALLRMGIDMDTSGLSAYDLADKINALTGNAAELEAQTASGQATQALNEWGNAWEEIGNLLLPLAPLIKGVSFVIGEAAAIVKGFGEGLAGVALILSGEFRAAFATFGDSWATYTGPIMQLIGATDEAAPSIAKVGEEASTAKGGLDAYAAAAKAAGVDTESLSESVAGFVEQAEKQKVTEAAILLLQKDRPDVAAQLNLQTAAQQKAAVATRQHSQEIERQNAATREKARLDKEQSQSAKRMIDDYTASTWSIDAQIVRLEGLQRVEKDKIKQAQLMIEIGRMKKQMADEDAAATEAQNQNYLRLASEGLMTMAEAQSLYTKEQLASVAVAETEQKLIDDFAALSPAKAEALGLVTTAQKAANKVSEDSAKLEARRKEATNAALAGLAAAGQRWKAFALVAKRVAQGQAIVETYLSARKTYTSVLASFPGPAGLVLAPIMTAAVIAGGLADVQRIGAQQFASGGYISGHGGTRSDSIPARLSAGEGVLNAAAVARIGGESAIHALNSGGGAGGGSIVVNFHGPVTDRDYVRDFIVPEVRRAARGLA